MEPVRKTVRVSILNQPYTLAVNDKPEEVEALARTVDDLMTSIAARSGNLDSTRLAVLACLHMADELGAARKELKALQHTVADKTQRCSVLLDAVLEAHTA